MPSNNYEQRRPFPQTVPPPAPTNELTIFQKIKYLHQARLLFNQIKTMNIIKGSWKTSLFGAGGLLTIWLNVANMLMDNNPATNPDWGMVITATFLGISTMFAKDSNVSNAPHPMKEAESVKP